MSSAFDIPLQREGTGSLKHDGRKKVFGTLDVLPMWVADMDFAAPVAVTEALKQRAAHPVYGYTLVPDSLYQALIDWMWKRHQWRIEPEWIVMTPGVVPSLNLVTMALVRPGQGVIVQPPAYPPFFSAASNTGRQLIENPLQKHAGTYQMDLPGLENCAARARLLLFCSPHNPVGRVWRDDELASVIDIAERHDLTILSDEIHGDLVYPGCRHRPMASLTSNPGRIVTAVAPSKTFNIPGLGLSALIVPDPARRTAINGMLDRFGVNIGNPFSILAFEVAYREGSAWLESLLQYLRANRDAAAEFLAKRLPQISLCEPQGTYLLWLDCRELGMADEELKRFFVHKARVGLSPGPLFGTGGAGFMRMNIGTPQQVLITALERIHHALKR